MDLYITSNPDSGLFHYYGKREALNLPLNQENRPLFGRFKFIIINLPLDIPQEIDPITDKL